MDHRNRLTHVQELRGGDSIVVLGDYRYNADDQLVHRAGRYGVVGALCLDGTDRVLQMADDGALQRRLIGTLSKQHRTDRAAK